MLTSPVTIFEHRRDSGFGHPVAPILAHVHQGPAEHELSDSLRSDAQSLGGLGEREKFLHFIIQDDLASDLVTLEDEEKFRGHVIELILS